MHSWTIYVRTCGGWFCGVHRKDGCLVKLFSIASVLTRASDQKLVIIGSGYFRGKSLLLSLLYLST